MMKLLDWFMDGLMFVVPILEMTEVMSFIPPEYLPVYMITVTVARRALRLWEDRNSASSETPVS